MISAIAWIFNCRTYKSYRSVSLSLLRKKVNIVPICSDNTEIHVNFALTVLPGIGARARNGNPAKTQYNWEFLVPEKVSTKTTTIILESRSAAESQQQESPSNLTLKKQKPVNIISFNLFEEEAQEKKSLNNENIKTNAEKQPACGKEVWACKTKRHKRKACCTNRKESLEPRIESFSLSFDEE